VAWAVGLRLLLAPLVVAGLSQLVVRVPDSYLTQAGMACALNSMVVANEYGLDRGLCAAAILWSTVLVVAAGIAAALL